jgi:hypothetical protein
MTTMIARVTVLGRHGSAARRYRLFSEAEAVGAVGAGWGRQIAGYDIDGTGDAGVSSTAV